MVTLKEAHIQRIVTIKSSYFASFHLLLKLQYNSEQTDWRGVKNYGCHIKRGNSCRGTKYLKMLGRKLQRSWDLLTL